MSDSRNQKKSSLRTSPICFGPVKNLIVLFNSASFALRTLSPSIWNARSHSATTPSHLSGTGGMFLGGNLSSPSSACAPPTPSKTKVHASSFALRQRSCGFRSAFAAGEALSSFSVVGHSRPQASRNCCFSLITTPFGQSWKGSTRLLTRYLGCHHASLARKPRRLAPPAAAHHDRRHRARPGRGARIRGRFGRTRSGATRLPRAHHAGRLVRGPLGRRARGADQYS